MPISSANVVSHWSMDEVGGTRSDSLSGYTATDNNTVLSTPGQIGNAAVFIDTQEEWLSVPSNSDLQSGDVDWWINFWFFLTSTDTQNFISKYNSSSGNDREYTVHFSSGGIFASTYSTGGLIGNPTITFSDLNNWHMLSFWHDASLSKTFLSLDDQASPVEAALTGNVRTTGAEVKIGAFETAPSRQFLDGNMDQVIFAKRIPTALDVTTLHNNGDGLANPFGDGPISRIVRPPTIDISLNISKEITS